MANLRIHLCDPNQITHHRLTQQNQPTKLYFTLSTLYFYLFSPWEKKQRGAGRDSDEKNISVNSVFSVAIKIRNFCRPRFLTFMISYDFTTLYHHFFLFHCVLMIFNDFFYLRNLCLARFCCQKPAPYTLSPIPYTTYSMFEILRTWYRARILRFLEIFDFWNSFEVFFWLFRWNVRI